MINSNAVDAVKDVEEFWLNSKVYILCGALIKLVLYIKQCILPILKWGKDIIERAAMRIIIRIKGVKLVRFVLSFLNTMRLPRLICIYY